MEIVAQIFGIGGMTLNIASYQTKDRRKLILIRLFGSALFVINFLLLGAWTGAMMNAVSVARAVIYANKEKFKAERPVWLIGFIAVYLVCYALTFAVFGKAPTAVNLLVELLPVIGMTAENIGFSRKQARDVRLLALVGSPTWLAYNIINLSIGGIVCECISLVSVLIGMIRYDFKKEKTV